jgi:AhpD family alkylhydroperoxidase
VADVSITNQAARKALKPLAASSVTSPKAAYRRHSSTLVDLDYLRVSQINNCAYCIDTHRRDLLRKGQSVEKFALVQAW